MAKSVKKSEARPTKSSFEIAVAEKVKELREAKGFSQTHIAAALGVSRGFIGQVESPTGTSKYSLNQINRLAKELDCSPKDMMPENFIKEKDWTDD